MKEGQERLLAEIERRHPDYVAASHAIHSKPEIGNEEFFASETLCDLLEEAGFEIEKAIAGHPTGFIARKESGRPGPHIAFLAEYDALPGLGHACGHNIIGTTSVLAAVSLSTMQETLDGTIFVFGTPAEEGGPNGSAKASYSAAGLFEEIDAAMMLHPNGQTHLTVPAPAVDVLDFEFFGQAAHASTNPEAGINALDAMIQFYNGINAFRQQLAPGEQIHGIILDGGQAPNIIPAYTKARFFTRALKRKNLDQLTERVGRIAEGAACQTGTTVKISRIQRGVDNVWVNQPFNDLFYQVAAELDVACEKDGAGVGSTDAGNVSQRIPTIHPFIKIGPESLVAHTDAFREAARSEAGDAAIQTGAKLLAVTALRLFQEPETLTTIKQAQARLKEQEK
ncbi:M20 family metallopeptidase [Listeria costaricensis]|uniref:M20 family metallopeptidase n=1 Tax=Listeria costaricensis TaxID=2026604 RepID=UPI000C074D18|nr:M20 family metallopeptidase [Listeria costaricensis]